MTAVREPLAVEHQQWSRRHPGAAFGELLADASRRLDALSDGEVGAMYKRQLDCELMKLI